MANPLITELELRRALDCHNPHKDHVPYDAVRKRTRGTLICIYKIMYELLDFPCDTVFAAPTVILSRFTNGGVKPSAANMRSAFGHSRFGINCKRIS